MIFSLTIFNFIEAVIFKMLRGIFGDYSRVLRYTKIISVVLIVGIILLLGFFVSRWLFGLFGLFLLRDKEIKTQKEINKINTENEQRINDERRESEAQTANVIRETGRKIREAEATPTPRKGNITGEELNKLARKRE